MKTQSAHAHEDRLLDFAYEELPASEARLVEQHLQGCPRCTQALAGIRGVRTSMARLSPESAPESGLDSLLAYAQQSARRSATGAEPPARWWRRLLTPALGVVAVSVFGVLVLQVNRQVVLSPALHKGTVASPQSASKAEQQTAPATAAVPPPPPSPVSHAEPMAEAAAQPTSSGPRGSLAPAARGLSQEARPGAAQADWSNAGAGSAGGFPAKKSYQANPEPMADDAYDSASGSSYGSSKTARLSEKRKERMAPAQNAPPERDGVSSEAEDLSVQEESKLARAEPRESRKDESPRPSALVGSTSAYAPSAPAPAGPASRPAVSLRKQAAEDKTAYMEGMSQDGRGGRSPSVGELLQQAETAHREGDPVQEVAFLRAAMTAGLQSSQRVGVFSRLCQAEAVLGNRSSAISFCKQVVALAPGSREALGAQRLLEGELQAPGAQ